MLGSSIARAWSEQRPHDELVALDRSVVDLRDGDATAAVIAQLRPQAIIHAAARVAGIAEKLAQPASFLQQNLQIDSSVISAAIEAEVPELLYVSSGAIYPADTAQPISESALLTGTLEAANEGYALAKITGGMLCAYASRQYGFAYRAAVPSNLYGTGDSFAEGRSHLVASTIAKAHAAVEAGAQAIEVWGDGTARREFTFADDLASWLVGQVGSIESWPALLNLGVGDDHSIREYYEAAARVTGFEGRFDYDTTKPSGVAQRLLDSRAARSLGWNPQTSLDEGYARVYDAFLESMSSERKP